MVKGPLDLILGDEPGRPKPTGADFRNIDNVGTFVRDIRAMSTQTRDRFMEQHGIHVSENDDMGFPVFTLTDGHGNRISFGPTTIMTSWDRAFK